MHHAYSHDTRVASQPHALAQVSQAEIEARMQRLRHKQTRVKPVQYSCTDNGP